MRLRRRQQESDSVHYTPRAQLFTALKQKTFSGENFNLLLNESQIHKGLTSGDTNQPLKQVDEKSPQSSFEISLPDASPEESEATIYINISGAQSELSVLSDECNETSLSMKQMPKSLLFYRLKQVKPDLPPVRAADKLSDSQAAETVSQSSDSSVCWNVVNLAKCSVRLDLDQHLSLAGYRKTADVEKILEKAVPLSGSADYNKGCSEPVKKVKSTGALRNAGVTKNLSSKGSKNDPMALQDLPVTKRSGRRVCQPLAHWCTQRILIDPISRKMVIAQENENRLDLPVVHFKLGNKSLSEDIGAEHEESRKTDFEKKEQKATKGEKQLDDTRSKKHRGRPRKRTDVVTQEMNVESSSTTDVINDRQGIKLAGGQLQEGVASADSVFGSLHRLTRRKRNQPVLGFHDDGESYVKQEMLIKTSGNCSTAAVDTACYSALKKKTLNFKIYRNDQSGGFTSTDCPQSSKVPQQTSPQINSSRSLTITRKRSNKSDLTDETSGSSRRRQRCKAEIGGNEIKISGQHGTKLNKTLILHDSKVIFENSEGQKVQNSAHLCLEKLLNRKENERRIRDSESTKTTHTGSVGAPSRKMIVRNENTGETGEQKKLMRRRSPRVHDPSHKYQDYCRILSNVQRKSRLNSDNEGGWSAGSAQKRTRKHSIKNICSRESAKLVYTKSDHLQKTFVMRHDSKKRRERATKDQLSFLTESPLLMQGLPPKPRPSQFHASADLSDLCDSDDSAEVEYFFSSDESET